MPSLQIVGGIDRRSKGPSPLWTGVPDPSTG